MTGLRIRLSSDEHAGAISAAARDLGMFADPRVLQQLDVVFESPDPVAVQEFWHSATDYVPAEDGSLLDPLRRDPALRFRDASEPRLLRNRIHIDVVRPTAAVERAALGAASGPYGVCHSDPDGNEVDLVPGSPLSEQDGVGDWQAVFSAMACYRVSSPRRQQELTSRMIMANSAQGHDHAGPIGSPAPSFPVNNP